MAALGDLVATVRAVDGLEVRYVPESLDAECRGRIAALAAGREPFDQRLYEPADIDLLKAL